MLLMLLAGGCAGPGAAIPAGGPRPTDISSLSWIEGRWQRPLGIEHWVSAGEVLWGVGFSVKDQKTASFEVLVIEPGERGLRYVAMPQGNPEVRFPAVSAGVQEVVFANPEHDFPKVIRYRRQGDELFARVEGDGRGEEFRWLRAGPGRDGSLETSDRAFAEDTRQRGVDGWMAAFDPEGVMWNRGRKVSLGGEAIRQAMAPLFARGVQIEWSPIASGLSPAGDLGYTIGRSRYTAADPGGGRVETHRGSYVSIWRRQEAGTWKVLFDTGI
jgi:ketosteroid isomerase-like protein